MHLIKMWLEAPVEETDEHGKKHRSTCNRDDGKGTSPGSPDQPDAQQFVHASFRAGMEETRAREAS